MFPSINTIEIDQGNFKFEEDPETNSPLLFQASSSRQCHIKKQLQVPSIASIQRYSLPGDTYLNPADQEGVVIKELPVGEVVRAIDAVNWSSANNVDVRPRLLDKSTGELRLIDSSAQISAAKRLPGDKEDETVRLVAVNGSKIKTFGTRIINLKINRKSYQIPAVICDIGQDILGMDFIKKYRLGLEWDEFDQSELYLVDKKANIKTSLQIITVDKHLQRAHHVESIAGAGSELAVEPTSPFSTQVNNRQVLFELACMNKLNKNEESEAKTDKTVEEQLSLHSPEYVELIKARPQLLHPTFTKNPSHGIFHKIETSDHTPCKAKRRPMIADAKKAAEGRRVWEKMLKDGVIEEVKGGTQTDWTSSLHLANKAGVGSVRARTSGR